MRIHRLTDETIGKIAAGEVIERPAAAVKELVENALDAGATRVDVSIQAGGIDIIEVRDDGRGIAMDDLCLAVERHATSKIARLDDLNGLTTLGFRGEALASLAAVADLTLQSIAADAPAGAMLRVRHGIVGETRPLAWGGGTAITARDLFENVPARRRFLRQPQTEANYVSRTVSAYALAYPQIAFALQIDGRRLFATDGSGVFLNAAVAVWGDEIAEALVELVTPEGMPEGFGVYGVVSLPHLDRATRQQQFLFAQGRLISSRQLGTAFEQAYHTLLMVGRHPLGCILVQVPNDRIDVNVHPTKAEVRFADDRLVFALVQRAVREAIIGADRRPPIPTIVESPVSDWNVQRRLSLAHPERTPGLTSNGPDGPLAGLETTIDKRQTVGGDRLPVLRVLGQIASMFVIAEGPDGMYMIDQHAAHERIMFERLMADYSARSPDTQLLLNPATVDLPPQQWEMYAACRDDLSALGFDIDEFGGSTVVIRGVPAKLKIRAVAATFQTILDEMISGGRGDSRLESLAISAACHTSIRAGQPLSLLEMRELVTQLEQCSSPLACGHGRPTMLRMSADELERQFSRR
jgi:DNA mismatch repair protein MutL